MTLQSGESCHLNLSVSCVLLWSATAAGLCVYVHVNLSYCWPVLLTVEYMGNGTTDDSSSILLPLGLTIADCAVVLLGILYRVAF